MASFLLPYPGAATNRDQKFVRAVNSFKKQSYQNKELIIVSDGCPVTIDLYNRFFSNDTNIKLVSIPLKIADGDIISYLDSDDLLGPNHLQIILDQFELEKYDWVYYNDYMVLDNTFKKLHLRIVEPRWASIGTSSVTHKNNVNITWSGGYGHDFLFMFKLASDGFKYKKLEKMSFDN